jgi:hypothetical protein
MSTDQEAVWIKSEPDENGAYHLYLELGPDDVAPLNAATAYGWARQVLSAVAQAEHDAAVIAQVRSLGMPVESAAAIVSGLRADRAPSIPVDAVPGLALVPGVSSITGRGFLRLERHGKPVGQWEVQDARVHALAVIEALEVTTLDSAYFRALTGRIGIDRNRAMQVIGDLGRHRAQREV